MKSKFFGFNAKLALALLAISGTMFTSCYESERDDISAPYTPPAALYTISGTVTDVVTGKAIEGATVSFSGAATASKTTDAGGAYYLITKNAGAYTIAISKDGYTSKTINVTTATDLEAGQAATYLANAVLEPTSFKLEGFKMTSSSTAAEKGSVIFDAEKEADAEKVDIVNDSDKFMDLTFNVKVNTGGRFEEDNLGLLTRSLVGDLKTYVENYLKGIYGALPVKKGADFATKTLTYEFPLAPNSSLKLLVIDTYYSIDTYNFSYAGEEYTIVVKGVTGYKFDNDQFGNDLYHGHGHGHGHGGDLNAGGGIGEGI